MNKRQRYIRRLRQYLSRIRCALILAFALLAFSCSTTRSSYVSDTITESFKIDSMQVSVEVDLIKEKTAEVQIEQMLKPLYYEQSLNAKNTSSLHIQVNERSLMDGIKPVQSVFISADVYLNDGSLLVSEHCYLSGRITLLAAKNQYKYIIPLVQNILKIQVLSVKETTLLKNVQKGERIL